MCYFFKSFPNICVLFCIFVIFSSQKLVDEQQALKRFADVSIDIYAVTACLARSSRSASIGLRNSEHELLIAKVFTREALKRVDDTLMDLDCGQCT